MRDKINDPARLELMLENIANVEEFLVGVTTYESFAEDKVLCHAVIYNMQCIGESVYMLSKEFRQTHPSMDWDAIMGLRHILVHDYYQVKLERVWEITQQDLAPLKQYLQEIIVGTLPALSTKR